MTDKKAELDELFSRLGYSIKRRGDRRSIYTLCLELIRDYDNEVVISVLTEQCETSEPYGLPKDYAPYCDELAKITLKKLHDEAKRRLIIPDLSRKYILITSDENGTHLFSSENAEIIDIAGFAYYLGVKADQLIKNE